MASLLDKSRQFAHIDLSDPAKVREAIATSGTAISGLQGDKKNLYVKEDSIRASLREADYTTKVEQDNEIKRMQSEEQIITIGNPEDLSDKQVSAMKKDLGLGDLPGLIETFGQTGEYNKEEMQALAERFDLFDDQKGFDEAYNDWVEKSLDPAQSKQTDLLGQLNSNVASIAASVVSKRIQEGHLDKPTAEQSEYATYGQKGVADTLGQLFSKGKDGNGNYFQSDASFERNKKAIEEQKKSYEDYLAVLKEGREKAKGSEKEKFDKEIASYEKMIGYLDQWIEDGEAAYNKHKQEEENNKKQNQPDTKKENSQKDTENRKPETTYDEERLKKQQDYWDNIDSKVFGFFDKLFTTDFGEQGRTQKSVTGEGIDIAGTPTEDPKEAARQAAREKFQSWIQGLIEGSQNIPEDPKTIAAQKAHDDYKSYIDGIREGAINQKMTGGVDAEVQTKTQEKITSMWQAVKAAFTSGGIEDPKVEAGKKAAEMWKSIWSSVKKAFSPESQPDIDPKTNGTAKKGKTVTSDQEVSTNYKAKISNPDELKTSLEKQIATVLKTVASEQSTIQANATINVKRGKTEGPKQQNTVVNYTKGKQAKADNQTAAVNYALGTQAPPQPKSTTVNYTLGRQASPSPKTVDISPNFVGTWRKTLVIDHGAKGKNNNITTSPLPSFGSAAKGARYGKIGPKGKGGLTLTGEEGFEIAWLPSESKSMIVGADGPQLLNLPSDAVIYTHEQSKKIVKQKSIPAGSHRGESSSPVVNRGGSGSGNSSSSGSGKGNNKGNNGNGNNVAKEIEKIIQKSGQVLVWWENVARRMDDAQRKSEKAQKNLDKLLKIFGTTAKEYKEAGLNYKQQLENIKSIAQEKINRATTEMGYTVNGRSSGKTATETKEQNEKKTKLDAAKKKLEKAKKTKNKKDDKKAKKAVEKAQKEYDATAGAKKDAANNALLESVGARQEISYNVTKKVTKKTKKGKKKVTTKEESKKENVNLADYIKYNADGVAIIDQDAITNIAKTNKSKAEAIKQAAEKQINDLNSKLKAAEDERIKAEEEWQQFLNDTYKAFAAWDRSITEVYFLGKELEKLGKLRSMYEAANELEFARLNSGVNYDKASNGLNNIIEALPSLTEALQKNRDLLLNQAQTNYMKMNAAYKEYVDYLNGNNVMERLARAGASGSATSQEAANELAIWEKTNNFLNKIGLAGQNFNLDEALKIFNTESEKLYNQGLKGEDYDKIKEGLDKIAEKQGDYYDAITETYSSMTEIYNLIEEYQSYISDFENSLIKGIEEQANKEINQLNKINSTLSNAAKELLDEVKRKLDERRKQEDNAKTERDISQKQQRLAALQSDTSGGHQVEIAQLQKEIAESQQGYERTLEDQLLDRLSQQQDEAAKQRDRQIALLEAQRDLTVALGTNVDDINKWLANPEQYYDDIRNAWLTQHGYEEAGAQERQQLEEQFTSDYAKFLAYTETLPSLMQAATANIIPESVSKDVPNSLIDIESKLDAILGVIPTTKELQKLNPTQDKANNLTAKQIHAMGSDVKTALQISKAQGQQFDFATLKSVGYTASELKAGGFTNASVYKQNNVSYAEAKTAFTNQELSKAGYTEATQALQAEAAAAQKAAQTQAAAAKAAPAAKPAAPSLPYGKVVKDTNDKTPNGSKKTKAVQYALNQLMGAGLKVDGNFGSKTTAAVKKFQKKYGLTVDGRVGPKTAAKFNSMGYKTGGLADYTGPAWLDGTPSKPELVLNSTDTKNFIALKDVLSKAMGSTNAIENTYGGDTTFEININVDHLNNDYDVDKVAERVKKIIVKDSSYRNVTQVRNFR